MNNLDAVREVVPEAVPWFVVALCVLVPAAVSWALTRGVRAAVPSEWRWQPLVLRSGAVLFGLVVGALIGGVEWRWEYGATLGALGGAMNTFLVWGAKRWARNRLGNGGSDAPKDE